MPHFERNKAGMTNVGLFALIWQRQRYSPHSLGRASAGEILFNYSFTLSENSPVRVSILILSPTFMNSGTLTL